MGRNVEPEIDRLPIDLLAHIFVLLTSFKDLAQASSVCRKWKQGVKQSLARRERLSFAGWKMDDESTTRLVRQAYNLKELDISKSRWGCQITDSGLYQLSYAKCIGNLSSISLWGMTGITDNGVVHLISRASSLQHLNIGGTFITDESLFVIASSCPNLKVKHENNCPDYRLVGLPSCDSCNREWTHNSCEEMPQAPVYQCMGYEELGIMF